MLHLTKLSSIITIPNETTFFFLFFLAPSKQNSHRLLSNNKPPHKKLLHITFTIRFKTTKIEKKKLHSLQIYTTQKCGITPSQRQQKLFIHHPPSPTVTATTLWIPLDGAYHCPSFNCWPPLILNLTSNQTLTTLKKATLTTISINSDGIFVASSTHLWPL